MKGKGVVAVQNLSHGHCKVKCRRRREEGRVGLHFCLDGNSYLHATFSSLVLKLLDRGRALLTPFSKSDRCGVCGGGVQEVIAGDEGT